VTGNDIIDLATAAVESNWKRKGFIEKIFTAQEQHYIREATLPEEMVWKLWSMKESAYKIYIRQYGGRFFAPMKFNCTLLTGQTGKVEINNVTYHTTTSAAENYIYSIARPGESGMSTFLNYCFRLPPSGQIKQQQFIYKKIINLYTSVTGAVKNGLYVVKDKNGIPFICCQNDKLKIPVSITHHGRYAAFTIY
jgi:phosphopantetheinyl transferase (holo-ACP synthase)